MMAEMHKYETIFIAKPDLTEGGVYRAYREVQGSD